MEESFEGHLAMVAYRSFRRSTLNLNSPALTSRFRNFRRLYSETFTLWLFSGSLESSISVTAKFNAGLKKS